MPESLEVLITLPFTEELITHLNGVSPRLKISVQRARKPEDIPAEVWQRVEVLYTNRVFPEPSLAPNVRWVQLHWAGVDHALNTPLLRQPGVQVTSLSGTSASQMAEYGVMMLLSLGHRLPDLVANQRRAEWPPDRWDRFSPHELRGSTVGIVGYGSVGRQIARLLQGFGATVLATKRDAMHPEDTGYIPDGLGDPGGDFVHRLYPGQAIASMLRECDFVVICAPLTLQTRNLVGAAELAALRPGACLVDLSRGGIVDQAALLAALKEQKLSAALDVFPEEPLPPDHPLWKLPNVFITPHVAGNTPQYDTRAVALFAENLHRYLAGLPLYNLVDFERGY